MIYMLRSTLIIIMIMILNYMYATQERAHGIILYSRVIALNWTTTPESENYIYNNNTYNIILL